MSETSVTTESLSRTGQYGAFNDAVVSLFDLAGYEVQREYRIDNIVLDLMVKNEQVEYAVEVKYMTIAMGRNALDRAVEQTIHHASQVKMTPMLIVSRAIEDSVREEYKSAYPDLIVLDTANLMYIASKDQAVYDTLVSSFPEVVSDVELKEPDQRIKFSWLEHGDTLPSIIKAFSLCAEGYEGAFKFENVCYDALNYAFADDLMVWRRQNRTEDGLFRFDLICRIKDGNQKPFWKMMEQFFHTKYIVFEFKNYKDKVSQSVVFTTEKYLYPKALRTVGIIISAHGADKHAVAAAKGVFRESGKLLLLLDKKDLIRMCEMKNGEDDPSNFLMDRLDQLLCELEK